MNYSLLIDTSDKYLSVGIVLNEKIVYSCSFEAWQRQSEFLVVEIEKALNSIDIKMKDIKSIIVGKGPGSYTGVRIALTFAKVLGSTTSVKVKTVSSLAILGSTDIAFVSLINARGGRSYIGIYDHGNIVLNDTIKTNDEVLALVNTYKKMGYEIKGDTKYLGIDSEPIDIVKGLFSFGSIAKYESEIITLKPVYLKEVL